jgi:hypothetical protein
LAGEYLFEADDEGPVWRIVSGTLRLDEPRGRHNTVVRIAPPGDPLGAELFCQSRYALFCGRDDGPATSNRSTPAHWKTASRP